MRVVSLIPSTTELLFQLGAGDCLVGITDWCIHPSEKVAAIEKVGGTKNPNVARIIELAPDWVFVNEEENRLEDSQALEAAGLRLHHSFPKTVEASIEMIRSVGDAVGAQGKAQACADQAAQEWDRVRRLAQQERPVRYAYLIWRKPWMAAGGDTYLTDLLGGVGGINVMADEEERYPAFELDALVEAQPEVVLLCSEPFPFQAKHVEELRSFQGLEPLSYFLADGEALTWHGSRTLPGIGYAWELLQGVRSPRG